MHLIAKTSRIPNIEDMEGWIINGAKYHVNDKYGFGVIDISNMLQEAQAWENVPKRQKCIIEYDGNLPYKNFLASNIHIFNSYLTRKHILQVKKFPQKKSQF